MDFTSLTDLESLYRNNSAHPNPMFDFVTGFVPRRLRDLFSWMEYLYYNSSPVFAALKKFSEYPITEITYETNNSALEEKHSELLEKRLKIKNVLILCGRDRWLYGNCFVSVYQPFARFLKCSHCGTLVNINFVNYTFRTKNATFEYVCKQCKNSTKGIVVDRRITNPNKINIIRWDPKQMDVDHNPVTDESTYYYTIPPDIKNRIQKGNKLLLNSLPLGFIQAACKNKMFKFSPGYIYHMKVEPPAGIDQQWGFPPLTCAMKLFFHGAILRKANEAIALDYLVPYRILSPRQASANADPIQTISISRLFDELKDSVKRHRKDPLEIMFSPVPVDNTQVGGDGRALLTLGELKEADDSIIASLGIPREFIYGGLNFTGSAITLRMLENQLETYTSELNDLLVWIDNRCSKIMGWTPVEPKLTPFRLIDDAQQKQIMLQLNQGSQIISNTTIAEHNNFDLKKERTRRKQEMLDEARFQQEVQLEIQKLQQTLAQQARMQAMQGQTGLQYDQQAVIGQADMIVQELMGLDHGSRRSKLDALQKEDAVMHAVVIQRLENAQTQQEYEAKSQARG